MLIIRGCKMKKTEKEIIKYLRRGKRVNISEIARELNLPTSTVSDRIKRIEQKYVLKRSSLLNYEKMGYYTNLMLAVKIDSKHKNQFLNFLKSQKCVNSIFFINSSFNFLFEVIFKDKLEYVTWLDNIKSNYQMEINQFQILKTEDKENFTGD